MGVELHPVTGGPMVNESLETGIEGVFSAGNALHVHDLVDYVSEEAATAGRSAAQFALAGNANEVCTQRICIELSGGIRYAVPSAIAPDRIQSSLTIRMRVGSVMKNKRLNVIINGEKIISRPRPVMAPGEMEQVVIMKDMLDRYAKVESILITTEDM